MITGFETETNPLREDEHRMATEISYVLMNHVGEESNITSTKLISHLNLNFKGNVDGARLRKLINYIRTSGMVKNLLATSKGYYVEPNIEKVQKYINGLRHRGESILAVSSAMEKQIEKYKQTS